MDYFDVRVWEAIPERLEGVLRDLKRNEDEDYSIFKIVSGDQEFVRKVNYLLPADLEGKPISYEISVRSQTPLFHSDGVDPYPGKFRERTLRQVVSAEGFRKADRIIIYQ